jgi:hypothetical protein
MGPNIQLIQLTLRVEREAEARRRAAMTYNSDGADEKTDGSVRQEKCVGSGVNLLRRQPQCECA